MPRRFTGSDSVVIRVGPHEVYRQVADPSRMREWSPENTGATVHGNAEHVGVGTVFDGTNRRGPVRWTTRCIVTTAEQDRLFGFRVCAIGIRKPCIPVRMAGWEYRFEAVPEGTRVTETWTDERRGWPGFVVQAYDRVATRGSTFAEFQVGNIRSTLHNLKAALERSHVA